MLKNLYFVRPKLFALLKPKIIMNKNLLKGLLSFYLIFSFSISGAQVINEYSCSNLSQYVDNHNDYEDWIELYNPTGATMNLQGYYLSDDSTDATKWQMPAGVTIPANGFARFWASGRDNVSFTHYHTNFKLKQTKNNKEDIVLSDPSGNIIDGVRLEITQNGHSRGRTSNGGSTWGIFTNPTPNASNNSATSYTRYADRPDFDIPAGFYPGGQTITITNTELPGTSTIRYTTNGTLPNASASLYSAPVSIPNTAILKAITLSSDPTVLPSLVEFETYFINVSHTIPVVSIS
jgi:hypothetical protein